MVEERESGGGGGESLRREKVSWNGEWEWDDEGGDGQQRRDCGGSLVFMICPFESVGLWVSTFKLWELRDKIGRAHV